MEFQLRQHYCNEENDVVSVESTKIEWKDNSKNPCLREIKQKKTKGKAKKSGGGGSTWESQESFFDIFSESKQTKLLDGQNGEREYFETELIPQAFEFYLDLNNEGEDLEVNAFH